MCTVPPRRSILPSSMGHPSLMSPRNVLSPGKPITWNLSPSPIHQYDLPPHPVLKTAHRPLRAPGVITHPTKDSSPWSGFFHHPSGAVVPRDLHLGGLALTPHVELNTSTPENPSPTSKELCPTCRLSAMSLNTHSPGPLPENPVSCQGSFALEDSASTHT